MMSPSAIKLLGQAIVSCMEGLEYDEKVNKAIDLCDCDGTIKCKYGHKGNMKEAQLCTICGKVKVNGQVIRRVLH